MSSLLSHFEDKQNLVNALRKQWLIDGDLAVAELLAEVCSLHEIMVGQVLIKEGNHDSTLHFILTGKMRIVIGDVTHTMRGEGLHVGEVALIDPRRARTATVMAASTVIVASVEEPDFTKIANSYPNLWRRLATELAKRSIDAMRNVLGPSS